MRVTFLAMLTASERSDLRCMPGNKSNFLNDGGFMNQDDLQRFLNYLESRIADFDFDINDNQMISDAVKYECSIRKKEVLRIKEDLSTWFDE